MYVCPCKKHEQHCEDCFMCRSFDKAVTDSMASFTLHPSQHPSVTTPKVKAWIDSAFPSPVKS